MFLIGLFPIPIFETIFLVLFRVPLKKTLKYGVLKSFFQQALGKTGKIGRKLGIGNSPLIEINGN